jgi:hypothetical protein
MTDNQKLAAITPLCYCGECGAVFTTHLGTIGGQGSRISFAGSTTRCPNGHRKAQILDGDYGVVEESFQLLTGPPLTVEIFQRVAELIASTPPATTSTALAEAVSVIDPRLGKVIEKLSTGSSTRGPAWLIALIVSVSLVCKCTGSVTLDINKLIDQIHAHPMIEGQPVSTKEHQK